MLDRPIDNKTAFTSRSVKETREIGMQISARLTAGDVVSINGDLGSGKTELTRGIVAGFCDLVNTNINSAAAVSSPTFSIVNTYKTSSHTIHHFDFYRIEDIRELAAIGFDEYICGDDICLIEWGDMYPAVLPSYTKHVRISDVSNVINNDNVISDNNIISDNIVKDKIINDNISNNNITNDNAVNDNIISNNIVNTNAGNIRTITADFEF